MSVQDSRYGTRQALALLLLKKTFLVTCCAIICRTFQALRKHTIKTELTERYTWITNWLLTYILLVFMTSHRPKNCPNRPVYRIDVGLFFSDFKA